MPVRDRPVPRTVRRLGVADQMGGVPVPGDTVSPIVPFAALYVSVWRSTTGAAW